MIAAIASIYPDRQAAASPNAVASPAPPSTSVVGATRPSTDSVTLSETAEAKLLNEQGKNAPDIATRLNLTVTKVEDYLGITVDGVALTASPFGAKAAAAQPASPATVSVNKPAPPLFSGDTVSAAPGTLAQTAPSTGRLLSAGQTPAKGQPTSATSASGKNSSSAPIDLADAVNKSGVGSPASGADIQSTNPLSTVATLNSGNRVPGTTRTGVVPLVLAPA